MLENGNQHTSKVDNWALGVLMHECLMGNTPFYAKEQRDTIAKIKQGFAKKVDTLSEQTFEIIKGVC